MITKEDICERRDEITRLAANYGAHDVRIFGSVARGDATEESDVDFLVRLDAGRILFDLGGLLMDLRDLLGAKVDVITEGSLYGRFGQIVTREAIPL
jgi:predicted nucleotidyltransferase